MLKKIIVIADIGLAGWMAYACYKIGLASIQGYAPPTQKIFTDSAVDSIPALATIFGISAVMIIVGLALKRHNMTANGILVAFFALMYTWTIAIYLEGLEPPQEYITITSLLLTTIILYILEKRSYRKHDNIEP